MNDKKIILSPQKQQNDTGIEGTNFYLIEDEHSIPIGQVFLRFEDTCVVITWIELMTLYRGQGYLLAVIRNIAEKFPEYQLCLEYDRKREGDYEESIEKLCSIGFEKILSARSKPRRLSYNGERCIFSKNDHLKLCEFHLPKKKKLVYKIIVFTVTSSVKEMAWYYLDGNGFGKKAYR